MALQSVQHPQLPSPHPQRLLAFFPVPGSSVVLLIMLEYRGQQSTSHNRAIKLPTPQLPEEVSMSCCTKNPHSQSLSLNHLTTYSLLGAEREKTPFSFTRNQLCLQADASITYFCLLGGFFEQSSLFLSMPLLSSCKRTPV